MTDEELKGLFETMQREVRGELVGMRGDLATMDGRIGSLRVEMAALGHDLRGEMAAMGNDLRGEVNGLRGEMTAIDRSLRAEIAAQHADTRHLFQITLERMDQYSLDEGLRVLDEKFDRRCDAIEEQLQATKAETQAMIRSALGRRVK